MFKNHCVGDVENLLLLKLLYISGPWLSCLVVVRPIAMSLDLSSDIESGFSYLSNSFSSAVDDFFYSSEDLSSNFLSYVLSKLARHIFNTFLSSFFQADLLDLLPNNLQLISLRTFTVTKPVFRALQQVRRFVADTGATHHLSYRLRPGDSGGSWQSAGTALGGGGWIQLSHRGDCIMPEPEAGKPFADELLCVGLVVEAGGSFLWEGGCCRFSHPSLDEDIVCTVENRAPLLTQAQFDVLRTLPKCDSSPSFVRFILRELNHCR